MAHTIESNSSITNKSVADGTTHDQAVFTDVAAAKASYVRLGLDT